MELLKSLAIAYTATTAVASAQSTHKNIPLKCPNHNIENMHNMFTEKLSDCRTSDKCDDFFRATLGIVNNGNCCGNSKYDASGNTPSNKNDGHITYNDINEDIRKGTPLKGYKKATVDALQNAPEFVQELSLGRKGNLEGTYYRAQSFTRELIDVGRAIEMEDVRSLSEGALTSVFANEAADTSTNDKTNGLHIEEYFGGGSIPSFRLGLGYPDVREALNPPSTWTIDQSFFTPQQITCSPSGYVHSIFDSSSFESSKVTTIQSEHADDVYIASSELFNCSNSVNSLSFFMASDMGTDVRSEYTLQTYTRFKWAGNACENN